MCKLGTCLLLCCVTLTLGCARGGAARYPISGTVAFNGVPVESGAIQFEPLEAGKGQGGGAPIQAGTFEIPADKGLLAGKYRVSIYSSTTGQAPLEPPAPGMKVAPELIPACYNSQSILTVDVGAASDRKLEFKLAAAR